jgi:hypothetical protein
MKFVTRLPADGHQDGLDGKRAMTAADINRWIAAGLPALKPKQLVALGRSLSYGEGRDPEEGALVARAVLAARDREAGVFALSQPQARPASPSRVPSNPTSSRPTKSGRTAGNPPKASKLRRKARRQLKAIRKQLLARGVDPAECKIMLAAGADRELQRLWLAQMAPAQSRAAGVDPDEATIMLGADPELRTLWLAQMADREPAPTTTAPLGMDDDRYRLHQEAKQLAADKMKADPRLDEAVAYSSAVVMLADRQNPGVI